MTLTEFYRLAEDIFGPPRADFLLRSHHLADCGGLTAHEAIEAGQPTKKVWLALCADFDVEQSLR